MYKVKPSASRELPMLLPPPAHYHQAFKDVKQHWNLEQLLTDLKDANGKAGFTDSQVKHLHALLAWGDLRATGQLEECDRFKPPTGTIARLLGYSENSVKTELSRSITLCLKQLLNLAPRSRIRLEVFPNLLQEKGYRYSSGSTPNPVTVAQQPEQQKKRQNTQQLSPIVVDIPNFSKDNREYCSPSHAPSRHKKLALVSTFYGRDTELKQLNKFLDESHNSLVLVCGPGGVGKTWLVTKWLETVQERFSTVILRRVWDRPPLHQLVWDIMQQLPGYTKSDMPESADQQIAWLVTALCNHQCLVILDDIHNLFPSENRDSPAQDVDGAARATTNSKGYEILFEALATNRHYQQSNSYVVAMGWNRPAILTKVESLRSPIPTLKLHGLEYKAAQNILAECNLIQDESSWLKLFDLYRGVPYSLKLVGTHIHQIYGRDISIFLADETVFLGDIESLIHQQFDYVSNWSKFIWLVLSKEGGCTSVSELRDRIKQQHHRKVSVSDIGRSLHILYDMKLIEKQGDRFSPPPVITKYALKRYQAYLPELIKRLQLPEIE